MSEAWPDSPSWESSCGIGLPGSSDPTTRRTTITEPAIDGGSFRDREGRVFYRGDKVFRALSDSAFKDWQALADTDFFKRASADGRIVATKAADIPAADLEDLSPVFLAALEHERLPFISYPYEWCFGQLRDAALLNLDLVSEALDENLILKDSSAYNIQWIGSRPIHIDIPSFQRWEPGMAWVGYRQFCQHFLYPLMLTAFREVSFRPWLRGALDGITPEECNHLLSLRDKFRRGVFSHVYLQSKLLAMTAKSSTSLKADLRTTDLGAEIIKRNLRGLTKTIRKLDPGGGTSEWSSYAQSHSYSDQDETIKRDFVARAAADRRWRMVWDMGCNTGNYSRIAADHADYVVAMDGDEKAIEQLYAALRSEGNERILPLVVNLADQSPNQGWNGKERKSLPERGRPELILSLALLHHLAITANIPLADLVHWLVSFGSHVVVEFVRRADPMVERLLLNRDDIYHDYHLEEFERLIGDRFRILDRTTTHGGTRVLFFLGPSETAVP